MKSESVWPNPPTLGFAGATRIRANLVGECGTRIVTAGFPCTDLSQAGRTAGITGEHSGLVVHLFDALRKIRAKRHRPWLLIENVQKYLSKGKWKEAVTDMEKLFALNPDPIIRVRMGRVNPVFG